MASAELARVPSQGPRGDADSREQHRFHARMRKGGRTSGQEDDTQRA